MNRSKSVNISTSHHITHKEREVSDDGGAKL